jgi:hypothetical protein
MCSRDESGNVEAGLKKKYVATEHKESRLRML